MKDELGSKIMTEFCALRAKLYAYKKLDLSESKRCKSIRKSCLKIAISASEFMKIEFELQSLVITLFRFRLGRVSQTYSI